MTYYKTVRPDLGSFHDPDFKYAIGKTRRAPGPRPDQIEPCTAGVLHASVTAPDATRYSTWPYRLLQVDGRPLTEPEWDGKVAFRQLTVLGELDVAECFGPNGAQVVTLLRQAGQMTAGQVARLAARSAARAAASDVAYASDYARRAAAWAVAYASDYARRAAASAASAASAAAWALVVADLVGQHGLEQHHIDTLLQPWISVMGDPREAVDA